MENLLKKLERLAPSPLLCPTNGDMRSTEHDCCVRGAASSPDVLLLYTVTPNDPASKGRNEVIGRFRVTSVSLLEAAEVRVCCSVLCMSLPCTVAGRRS